MKTIQEMARPWGWLGTEGWTFNRLSDLEAFAALVSEEAQRKPLTDKEISDIWCKVSNTDFVTADTHEFARVIEAAHGIKE